jgi:Survival protein SurE
MLVSILITNDDGIEAPGLAVLTRQKDQDQAIEIPRFQAGETGDNRRTKAEAAMISGTGRALERMRPGYRFMVCSSQGAPSTR